MNRNCRLITQTKTEGEMKKVIGLLVVLTFLMVPAVFAEYHKDKKWDGLEGKFCYKAEMIKEHGEEAGLTEAQIREVKDLKYATKKQVIEMDAKMESLKLDLWQALYEKPADMAKIDSLIDQKYDIKKAKAKLLAAAYVKACNMPTKEQWKKIKAAKHSKRG